MPYWDEVSYDFDSGSISRAGVLNTRLIIPRSFVWQRTYRSGGGKGQRSNVSVPLSTAEPYTAFEGVNDLKIRAYLKRFGNDGAIRPDRGHSWEMIKHRWTGNPVNGSFGWSGATWSFEGAIFDAVTSGTSDLMPSAYSGALAAYASQQYSKAAPSASKFNLAQFLGELREGLPGLIPSMLTKARFFKSLGGDYLNVEFGWKPFISDLQNLGEALASSTAMLTGFTKPIHRARTASPFIQQNGGTLGADLQMGPQSYPTTPFYKEAVAETVNRPVGTFPVGSVPSCFATLTWSTHVESRMWYEAEYVLVPKIGFNPDSFLDRLEALMATDITPSVLWELAPWSWLIDWFLKIGDTIASNEAASTSRLLSNYAYAMEESVVRHGQILTNIRGGYPSLATFPSQAWQSEVTHKRRIRANPYGFNPVNTSITRPEQWAILGALALAK